VASAQRRRQWRARSEGGGGARSGERAAAAVAATAQPIFFLFPNGATPPGLKPAVMVRTIIIGSETGGDSYFEPTVMGGAGVVFQTRFVIKLC